MKEFIEKLIGRLEEHKTKAYVTGITNNPYEFGACNAMDSAIEIVNQLAEEYSHRTEDLVIDASHRNTSTEHINCSTDTSTDCSKCSRRSWYQKGYTDAEKKLEEEYKLFGNSEQVNNGWIPCSERLPEEKENPITHDYMQYPVMVNIGGTLDLRYYYFGNGHWRLGLQIMDKYVTHWMDIAPYQPKGE
jgi:hypothetical protein